MQSDSGDDGDNSIFGQIQMPLTRTPFVGLSEEDEREGWGCTQGKVFQSGPLTQNIQKQNCLMNLKMYLYFLAFGMLKYINIIYSFLIK